MRALLAESDASTAHVADLGLRASVARAIRRLDTRFAFERVELADERVVGSHGFGDLVPVGGVQGRVGGPSNGVCVSSGILKLPDRSGLRGVEGSKRTDISIVGVGIVDGEIASVDFIHAVATVQVGERSDARSDPANAESVGGVLDGAVVGIVDHELIFVSVAEEDVCDHMGRVTVNDLVEQI